MSCTRWLDEDSDRTAPNGRPARRCGMRRCSGMLAVDGPRVYGPIAGGTPVRAGEKHRRLPVDVRSLLLRIILYRADGFQFQRIEGAWRGLHAPGGDTQVARGG